MSIKNYSVYSAIGGMLNFDDIFESDFTQRTGVAVLTDLNTMYGVPYFITECEKRNIKPIIGATVKVKDSNDNYLGTTTIYAKNKEGLKSVQKIVSELVMDSKQKEKFVLFDHIFKNKENIKIVTGGYDSIIYNYLKNKDTVSASRHIYDLKNIFKDDLFLEIQENTDPNTTKINEYICKIGEKNNIKVLFTQNNRMKNKTMYPIFIQKMKSVKGVDNKTNEYLENEYLENDVILSDKETIELQNKYKKYLTPINNFLNDFEKFNIFYDIPKIPVFPNVKDKENYLVNAIKEKYPDFIRKVDPSLKATYDKRIKEELAIIFELGFQDYFTVLLEIEKNKQEDQKFNLRGSGVSFVILKILGLTDIDAVKFGLLKERFLNKNRLKRHELPDLDLESNDIDSVALFLKNVFGSENVGYMAKNSQMYSKTQLSLALESLKEDIKKNPLNEKGEKREVPYEAFKKLNKFISGIYGSGQMTLKDLLMPDVYINKFFAAKLYDIKGDFKSKEFNNEYYKINNLTNLFKHNPDAKALFGYALKANNILGPSQASYGSIVIANNPISDYFGVIRNLKKDAVLDIAIESGKDFSEKLGLVKYDVLSNIYLDKIKNAYKLCNLPWDLDPKDPYSDSNVFKMIGAGYTETINQLKSSTQRALSEKIGITKFEELPSLLALIRPGVGQQNIEKYIENKNNPEKIVYKHPHLKEILEETYGIIIFEEQVMLLAQKIGGFSGEESDDFRALIKKSKGIKNKPDMAEKLRLSKERIKKYAITNLNMNENDVNEIIQNIEAVEGGYTFSKAHSLAYSSLIYRQGYIDVNYPAEYLQTFIVDQKITSDRFITKENKRKKEKESINKKKKEENQFDLYIDKLIKMGRKFLTCDINRSEKLFKTRRHNGELYIDPSLEFILKDEKMTDIIISERKKGKFENIYDFIERTLPRYSEQSIFSNYWLDPSSLNKQSVYKLNISKLINTGAFDSLFPKEIQKLNVGRTVLLSSVDKAMELTVNPYSNEDFFYKVPEYTMSPDNVIKEESLLLGYSPTEQRTLKKRQDNVLVKKKTNMPRP